MIKPKSREKVSLCEFLKPKSFWRRQSESRKIAGQDQIKFFIKFKFLTDGPTQITGKRLIILVNTKIDFLY